ncbi:hypothetical protein LINPERHAP2_LOCUS39188 [Linum perenne]
MLSADFHALLETVVMAIPDHRVRLPETQPRVKINANTQRADCGKFVRLVVHINLNEPLTPVVSLDGVLQLVEYEDIPILCFTCSRVGHPESTCPLAASNEPGKVFFPSPIESGIMEVKVGVSVPKKEGFGPWMVVTGKSGRAGKVVRIEEESAKFGESGLPLKENLVMVTKERETEKDEHEISMISESKEVVDATIVREGNRRVKGVLT